ncbi:hypothetical protein GCM10008014_47990 [Paenibacillus silvae]|uniref:Uncharacterized protein n=1 Tax=Paenibacillus silvae TaxID=1325358 RepID=A0ABQ1ZIV6_9BACL|nr:hypothetical protein [Paenibacillus silvae]GGH66993.1 hypothetical protein GCM10008014_47990 [Paenibacillus silvae]
MHKNSLRRWLMWGLLGITLMIFLSLLSILNNVGYSNVKQIIRLETSGPSIIRIEHPKEGMERYLTKDENDPQERLKSRMSREGWAYEQQEGSGYFFTKDGQQTIVTLQRWNHFYVIYNIKAGVVNLEG